MVTSMTMILSPFRFAALSLVLGLVVWMSILRNNPSQAATFNEPFILDNDNNDTIRLLPSQILAIYKQQHSHEALLEACSSGCPNQKFIVGYYSCPLQAGNRIHHFINAFVWAVVTNRTLLWKYYDRTTCLAQGTNHDLSICASSNTEPECAQVLTRSQWIASSEEWTSTLQLGNATLVPYTKTKINLQWRLRENRTDSLPDQRTIDLIADRLIDIGQLLGRDADAIGNAHGRQQLLQTTESVMVADGLFSKGQRYLYGLLLDEAFSFHDSVLPSLDTLHAIQATSTIALHSRHTSRLDEGDDVSTEKHCLEQVLANISRPCTVILLSDRPKTLDLLSEVVTNLQCIPTFANHKTGTSFRKDHGPYSGVGFFQDLSLASNAVHGFIGHKKRSSSMLLEEWIVYRRSLQKNISSTPLVECYLPKH
jgi:hypothetical protein